MLKQPSFLFQTVIYLPLTVSIMRHFPQVLQSIHIGDSNNSSPFSADALIRSPLLFIIRKPCSGETTLVNPGLQAIQSFPDFEPPRKQPDSCLQATVFCNQSLTHGASFETSFPGTRDRRS